jgi:23S rRNA (guanosine2251-2'-O)-methyltransferase
MPQPDRRWNRQGPPGPKGRGERRFPPRNPAERRPDALWIYGLHPVIAALTNPKRHVKRVLATPNALIRLKEAGVTIPDAVEESLPRDLDRLLGGEAVHQGVAIEVAPLDPAGIDTLADARLVVVLDQITDPHNVGAILRSALAFDADAVITTARHAPVETGVLAKAASGALDRLAHIEVKNLARALDELATLGFLRVGLDSEAEATMESVPETGKIALVLGAEGKGLRHLTRETCDVVARLPVPGALASLNVSNAAVLALYLARQRLAPG